MTKALHAVHRDRRNQPPADRTGTTAPAQISPMVHQANHSKQAQPTRINIALTVICFLVLTLHSASTTTASEQNNPETDTQAAGRMQEPLLDPRNATEWLEIRNHLAANDIDVQIRLRNGEIVPITMTRETATERRGFLRLKWRQREVVNLEVIEIRDDLYIVRDVQGHTSLKAPLGTWHVTSEQVPAFYAGPSIGEVIHGNINNPMRNETAFEDDEAPDGN